MTTCQPFFRRLRRNTCVLCQKALRVHMLLHGRSRKRTSAGRTSGASTAEAPTRWTHGRVHFLRGVSPACRHEAQSLWTMQAGDVLQRGVSEGPLAPAQEDLPGTA